MTLKNFQHLVDHSDRNGVIDSEDVVAVKVLESYETVGEAIKNNQVGEYVADEMFKRNQLIEWLTKYSWIVFMDKYGNGYSKIIL